MRNIRLYTDYSGVNKNLKIKEYMMSNMEMY